jgi:hypothetical protein
MFGFRVSKITAADVGRALTFADTFFQGHASLIPVHVQTAWADFRGVLLKWKTDLAAQEGSKR